MSILERLQREYNPDNDLFSGNTQMNWVDSDLLYLIEKQQAQIKDLAARLAKLEVFTGMVAPEPLPETKPAGDAPTERAETAYFVDGEVDYASGGDGQALESIY